MTPDTQRLVTDAIHQALRSWAEEGVRHVFRNQISVEEFITLLNTNVGIHENLIAQLEPDKEIEDAVQGRDRADWPQDVSATHEAKTVWEGGWEGVPQHGGD